MNQKDTLVWLHILVINAPFPVCDQEGTQGEWRRKGFKYGTPCPLMDSYWTPMESFSSDAVTLELSSHILSRVPVADGLHV